jgi:hypothetical protein
MTPDGEFTEREVGAALQELQEVRHDHRNLRQIVVILSDQQERMKLDHAKLQTRLTTIASIGVGLFSLIGFLLNYITR